MDYQENQGKTVIPAKSCSFCKKVNQNFTKKKDGSESKVCLCCSDKAKITRLRKKEEKLSQSKNKDGPPINKEDNNQTNLHSNETIPVINESNDLPESRNGNVLPTTETYQSVGNSNVQLEEETIVEKEEVNLKKSYGLPRARYLEPIGKSSSESSESFFGDISTTKVIFGVGAVIALSFLGGSAEPVSQPVTVNSSNPFVLNK
jgi:hypothetical protein